MSKRIQMYPDLHDFFILLCIDLSFWIMLLVEALVVGVITVIIGLIVGAFVAPGLSVKLPDVCESWNEKHVMEISLFLTGFLAHIFFEFTGANKWYCRNGVACQSIKN